MPLPLLLAVAASSEPLAHADPPPEKPRPIQIAALGGYGVNDSNASGGDTMNLYGAGLGARAGYTFAPGAYVGASFLWSFGFSKDLGNGLHGTGRVAPVGAELGWDFSIGRVTLRPFVGAGVALYKSSLTGTPNFVMGSGTKAALWPGVLATVAVADGLYAGLDARYTVVFTGLDTEVVAPGGGSTNALGLYGTIGYRFDV